MERRSASDPGESDLLAQARGGNLFAFEEVVRRYQRRVYGVAYRIVRRHDVADDVAQEAFIRAHRALASFDPTRPFGPWICRIAANLAINHVRSPEAREEELPEGHAE
ncbi:MAG: RNA polymerase sigma factor, partial [Vicinamibacteria bacterium]